MFKSQKSWMYLWYIRRLWYTSLPRSDHKSLNICLTVTPRHLPQRRRNQRQAPLARKWQRVACHHQLQITYQPGDPSGVQKDGNQFMQVWDCVASGPDLPHIQHATCCYLMFWNCLVVRKHNFILHLFSHLQPHWLIRVSHCFLYGI